jgi:uncharacterized membrane protein YesL
MRDAISVYGRAVLDLYEEWFSLIIANLITFFCLIPGLTVFLALLAIAMQRPEAENLWVLLIPLTVIAILTGGPALAAIHNLSNPIPHEKRIDFSYFWEGFKLYYLKSWEILGLWVLGTAMLAVNIWFYRMWWQRGTQIAIVPVILFLWIIVLWIGIAPYLFSLLIEQEDKGVLLVFRNATLLALVNPGFTVLVIVLLGATLLLSLIFPPLLLLASYSLVALVDNGAIVQLMVRLEEQRTRYGLTEEEDAESEEDEDEDTDEHDRYSLN